MDAVRATIAATTTSSTPGSTAPSTAKAGDGEQSFAALFAAAKDDLKKGEKLSKVDGHEYARIKGGTRDDMCVNLSGNERSGQAFDLIWRDGRQFHVYGGSGADHKVVEIGHKAAKTGTSTTTGTSTPTGTSAKTDASGGTTASGT